MATRFAGYPRKGITWLRRIAVHNERDWFRANRATYDTDVEAPTRALVAALNARLENFAPDYVADPTKAVPRVYRDVRFSKDKSPYKTYVSAMFGRNGGKMDACAGFRLYVSAKGVDVVGGAYAPGRSQLAAIRARLAADPKAFEALCRRPALRRAMGEIQGEKLQRIPRGWPRQHAAGELLKHRQLYFRTQLPVAIATRPDLIKEIARRFKLMTPVVEFLDAAMLAER